MGGGCLQAALLGARPQRLARQAQQHAGKLRDTLIDLEVAACRRRYEGYARDDLQANPSRTLADFVTPPRTDPDTPEPIRRTVGPASLI